MAAKRRRLQESSKAAALKARMQTSGQGPQRAPGAASAGPQRPGLSAGPSRRPEPEGESDDEDDDSTRQTAAARVGSKLNLKKKRRPGMF